MVATESVKITAQQAKALRGRTGVGMMECKRALVAVGGDMEAAVDWLRKAGVAKADKKAARTAAEGRIALCVDGPRAAMAEVNCETDFVAGGEPLREFAEAVAARALADAPPDVETLLSLPLDAGVSVAQRCRELIARIGENIVVRRIAAIDAGDGGVVGAYLHAGRIGALVALRGGDGQLAKEIAMHIAASRPQLLSVDQAPDELIERERAIFAAQAAESGKPPHIVDKMVAGRVRKFLNEITLLEQPFVKDPDRSVAALLKAAGAEALSFQRLEVGEGIERKQEDFAAEVARAAQP